MSVEVSPVGMTCNLSCPYCYEHPLREAGNFANNETYNLEKMLEAIQKENRNFSLFGGEPLLTDIDTIEALWKFGYEKYGRNGVQTNGTLITDRHIELFKKYNVLVGVSIDGPDDLNDARWAGSLNETRRRTKMTQDALDKMLEQKVNVGLIVTLHKLNASDERLPRLKEWFKDLDRKGLTSSRLHPLEVEYDSVKENFSLTPDQNLKVLFEMVALEKECANLKFDKFTDVKRMLLVDDSNTTCTFHACDPYTTRAVQGIDGQGNKHNCGRVNKDGVNYVKSDTNGYERQLALYHTPQEDGGCKDCRFFIMCKGQCPGTGINYDWRNKTDLCEMYFKLFEKFEQDFLSKGILPLSQSPERLRLEQELCQCWAAGQDTDINNLLNIIK